MASPAVRNSAALFGSSVSIVRICAPSNPRKAESTGDASSCGSSTAPNTDRSASSSCSVDSGRSTKYHSHVVKRPVRNVTVNDSGSSAGSPSSRLSAMPGSSREKTASRLPSPSVPPFSTCTSVASCGRIVPPASRNGVQRSPFFSVFFVCTRICTVPALPRRDCGSIACPSSVYVIDSSTGGSLSVSPV